MRKFLKVLPFKKVFVFLFVFLYTLLPSLQAFGVVLEDYALEDVSTEVDISEDILEEGISTSIYEEEEVVEPLFVYKDGIYTVNTVVEGEEYVYPDDGDVRVRFTSVTEEGDLVISKVKLTEEEKEELNTSDDYGWDISSSMDNGTFTYDLTLPNTQDNDDVEVKYTEDGNTYESIENVEVNEGVIYIEGLEHFTVFVVVDSPNQTKCDAVKLETTPYDTCFPTIQQAIEKANDGDDIYVAPGVYNEGYISMENKSVDLIGDNATIKAISSDATAVITINNATTAMTIEGFTIDAENVSGRSGIYIQNGSSNITVKDNNIINFTDKGVLISNSSNGNIVQGNTITGSTSGSNSGIYVGNYSESNVISKNTITLATTPNDPGVQPYNYNIWFTGFIMGANTVTENILSGGARSFQQDSSVTGTVTFLDNTIENPSWAGLSINGGGAIITGNFIEDSMRPIEFGGSGEITITNNIIDGTTHDFINIGSSFTGTLNPIQHNAFLNMGTAKLHNRTVKEITATENYWGDLDPSDNINNDGGGNIDYSPWWGENYVESDHSTEWNWYTNDSIQEAIDTASSGDTINLWSDFTITQQININKPLTLAGNDHTISSSFTKTDNNNNSAIGIFANNVTIKSLIIDGSAGTDLHGINIYKVVNVLLDDVTLKNNYNAGLIVNGSKVTVNNIATSKNGWYGINVDQGDGVVSPSQLTITGTSIHDESIASNVAIYLEDITNWGTNVEVVPNNQYYYINDPNGIGAQDRAYFLDTTAPPIPTHISPSDGFSLSSHSFTADWTDVTDDPETGTKNYDIEFFYNGAWRDRKTVTASQRTNTANYDLTWKWRVRARDNAENVSDWSEPWTVTLDITKPIMTNYGISDTLFNSSENSIALTGDITDNLSPIESVNFALWNSDKSQNFINWTNTSATDGAYDSTDESTNHNIDISTLPEGDYVLGVRGYDMAGNKASGGDHYFTIDRTPPVVTLTSPSDNYYTNQTSVPQKWTTDATDVNYYEYRSCINDPNEGYCNKEYKISTGKTASRTVNNNNVTFWWQVRAIDNAGNVGEWSTARKITIDGLEPTISFSGLRHYDYRYPSTPVDTTNTSTNDNTPIVLISASDSLSGMSSVTVNGETAIYDGSTYWIVELTTPLSDGTKTLEIVGTDKAGNITTVNQDIFIDTVAPTAIYIHYLRGNLITDEIAYVKRVGDLSFKGTINDTISPSSGILKDSFVIFEAQEDGSFRFSANGKKAFCSWRSTPNLVTFTGLNNTETIDTAVEFSNCTGSLEDGEYYMAHQVYDSAVRQDIPTIHQYRDVLGLHFVVDNVAPISNINIIGTLAEGGSFNHNNGWHGGGWYHHFSEVKPYISSGSELDDNETIQYEILNTNETCPTALSNPAEIASGTNIADVVNSLNDGVYTLCYQAKDSAGNLEPLNKEVLKIDRTSPTYTIDFDSINGIVDNDITYIPENKITVNVEVGDTLSGYTRARYDLYTADENWNCTFDSSNQDNLVPAENNTTRALTVSGLSDGRYCLKIWIYDDVQNKSRVDTNGEQSVHFMIDTTKPTLSVTNPSIGNILGKQFTVDGAAEDLGSGLAEIRVRFRDSVTDTLIKTCNPTVNNNWTLDIGDGGCDVPDGNYKIVVRAKDNVGNTKFKTLTNVTIDSLSPTIKPLTQDIYNLSEGDTIPDIQTEVTDETGLKRVYYELANVDLGTFNDDMDLAGTSEIVDITGLIETYAKDYFGEDITTIDTYYIPEGVYTIEYYVEDIAGNISPTETITINITNVAPIVDSFIADVLSITEGDIVNFEAIFSDPSYIEYPSGEKHADDADWIYAFNPEGTYEPELTTDVPGETLSFSHTYNNEGTYLAEFKVCEDSLNPGEGKCTTEQIEIVVSNYIPTVTVTPANPEVTQGGEAVVLSANVTNGNAPFTYQWTGACTGTEAQTTFNPTTEGNYTCTVTITDVDGDIATSEATVTVGAVAGATNDKTTTQTEQQKKQTSTEPLGIGGYTLAQTDEQDIEEEEITEEETVTQDSPEVKGEEDNGELNSEEETTQEETTKWWIYPLVILPILAIFLILWKRRKEDNEPQF